MKRFALGQRVVVSAVMPSPHADAIAIARAAGTVVRLLMRDDSAWSALDARLADELHPFPADEDERGKHVLAWPEDCEVER